MQDRGIVHVVDDDEAVRQSLAFLLGSAGLAVRLYDSAPAFLEKLSEVRGGCLITENLEWAATMFGFNSR